MNEISYRFYKFIYLYISSIYLIKNLKLFCIIIFLGRFIIELAEYEKNVERQMHKYNAYRKAAGAIQKHPVQILSGDEAKKLVCLTDNISNKCVMF